MESSHTGPSLHGSHMENDALNILYVFQNPPEKSWGFAGFRSSEMLHQVVALIGSCCRGFKLDEMLKCRENTPSKPSWNLIVVHSNIPWRLDPLTSRCGAGLPSSRCLLNASSVLLCYGDVAIVELKNIRGKSLHFSLPYLAITQHLLVKTAHILQFCR